MNILGVKISVDRDPSASVKWTRRTAVMGTAIVLVAGTGVAFAAWTATGSGSGTAAAGTLAGVTTTAADTSGLTQLFPGVSNGDLKVVFDNSNTVAVNVTSVTIGTIAADSAHVTAGCTNATNAVTIANQSGLNIPVGAKTGGVDGTFTKTFNGIVSMGAGSPTSCQGATFTVTLTAIGTST